MITRSKNDYIKDAIYISYTSLSDFLKCPRSYYLKNLYKDPKTNYRLQIASPYLSLGSVVHDTVKWMLDMQGQVTKEQLEAKFRNLWLKFRGHKGGFSSSEEEASFGKRGLKMIDNFFNNWKVLEKPAPVLSFPKYNLLENVVLMGNFDFVGEKEDGTLHIVDFKTGANDEKDSLQLYIYGILAESNFGKPVSAASFWYLDRDDAPREIVLDPLEPQLEWLTQKAIELKEAIAKGEWICARGFSSKGMNGSLNDSPGEMCNDCRDYEAILKGKGEFQFSDHRYKKDIYYLDKTK